MIVSPEPPHDDEAEYAAEVLKLLADRTRLSILAMLSPVSYTHLTLPTTSRV